MLEQIDLKQSLDKAEYVTLLPRLQQKLYDLHHDIFEARIPVVAAFEGWAAAGKGSTIQTLVERLDPRGFRVVPITPPRTAETHYPWLWRFWQKIPAYGQMVIFDTSWYRRVLIDRIKKEVRRREIQNIFEDIKDFESQLAADGAVIIKFWMHISKKEQAQRFKKLLKKELTSWQVTDEDAAQHKAYDDYLVAVEEMLARTDMPHAPWTIIEATDRYFTRIKVFQTLISAFEARLAKRSAGFGVTALVPLPSEGSRSPVLGQHDLNQRLTREAYQNQINLLQNKLHILGYEVYQQKRPVAMLFEGWDAAGKGGAIKRLTAKLDPRGYIVHSIAAPSGDDKVRHYLYRFWRRLPEAGQIAIFDRSWYGRVLVERVEGFCTESEWKRAYSEINQFERQIEQFGTILIKFWLHISQVEQLKRFQEREQLNYKAWKLTDEDWRNRGKWQDYERALEDMLLKTSTHLIPWTIVEANDKLHARVKVLKTVVDKLEYELKKE